MNLGNWTIISFSQTEGLLKTLISRPLWHFWFEVCSEAFPASSQVMVSSHTLRPIEIDDLSDSFQPFPTSGPATWLTSFISCRAERLLLILHVVTSQWLWPDLVMIQEESQYDLEKNADENYSLMYSFTNLFNQSLLSIPHAKHCAKYWYDENTSGPFLGCAQGCASPVWDLEKTDYSFIVVTERDIQGHIKIK